MHDGNLARSEPQEVALSKIARIAINIIAIAAVVLAALASLHYS